LGDGLSGDVVLLLEGGKICGGEALSEGFEERLSGSLVLDGAGSN